MVGRCSVSSILIKTEGIRSKPILFVAGHESWLLISFLVMQCHPCPFWTERDNHVVWFLLLLKLLAIIYTSGPCNTLEAYRGGGYIQHRSPRSLTITGMSVKLDSQIQDYRRAPPSSHYKRDHYLLAALMNEYSRRNMLF